MISSVKENMFLKLVKKEAMADKFLIIAIAMLIFAVNIILIIFTFKKSDGTEPGYVAASVISFFFLSFFWVFLVSIRSLSKEWELNTSYLIMSLPVSGMKLLSAKIASILFIYTAFTVEGSIMSLIVSFINKFFKNTHINMNDIPLILVNFLIMYIYVLVILTLFIVLFQMAFVISRLTNKFSKILTGISVFSISWLFLKGSFYLSQAIDLIGLPDIRLLIVPAGDISPVNVSPIISGVLLIAVFFYLTAKLFDHVVEV